MAGCSAVRFSFFSFERVTTEMDFGRSKTDWKHLGVISKRERARECFLSCWCLFNGWLKSPFTPDWVITIFHFFLYQLDFSIMYRLVCSPNDFLKLKPKVPLRVDVSPTENVGTFRWMSEAKCIKTYLVDVSKRFFTWGNSRVSSKQNGSKWARWESFVC